MPRLRLALLLALCVSFASGCFWSYGRFDPLDRGDDFDDARKHFTRSIRWSQFEAAARWVPAEDRAAFMAEAGRFAAYRFTDYEVELVDLDEDFRSGTVDVVYKAYSLASLIEQSVRVSQAWERDAESGAWVVRPIFHASATAAQGRP